jgi:hypothetical protein
MSKAIGFVAGGLWVYFNFIKSRTYYPRMELTCAGTIFRNAELCLVAPRITLKHIGKSKISLEQEGSGYQLLYSDGLGGAGKPVEWETDGSWRQVFLKHHWIEPDETIFQESEVFVVPSWALAVKVEARIVGRVRPLVRERFIVWNNSVVTDCSREPQSAFGDRDRKGDSNDLSVSDEIRSDGFGLGLRIWRTPRKPDQAK